MNSQTKWLWTGSGAHVHSVHVPCPILLSTRKTRKISTKIQLRKTTWLPNAPLTS